MTLLNKGCSLSENTIKKMSEYGFQGAYIETEISENIIIDEVLSEKERKNACQLVNKQDILGCIKTAKDIVKIILDKEILNMDYLDIRNAKNYTAKHSVSVCIDAIAFGIGLKLNEKQLEDLAVAGILHDIGKFQLEDNLLHSKNKYTDAERELMKMHPRLSYDSLEFYHDVSCVSRNAILMHHENVDGSGYYGYKDKQLTIYSKILRVVDVYDALTSNRKYRDAYSPADAIEFIMSKTDVFFDREVVNAFIDKFPLYPVGFTVELSNKDKALIVSSEHNALRPIVRIMRTGELVDVVDNYLYRGITIKKIV